MQAVARKAFGHKVGEHRAAKMVKHLRITEAITQVGSYRSLKHGFRVAVYRLHSSVVSSVRRKASVKARFWWQHGLFGNPEAEIPEGTSEERLSRWKSKAWFWAEMQRAPS